MIRRGTRISAAAEADITAATGGHGTTGPTGDTMASITLEADTMAVEATVEADTWVAADTRVAEAMAEATGNTIRTGK